MEWGDPKRDALLRAALQVFTKDGFHLPGSNDLARAAGLSVGTLYSRFDGKAGLAQAVLDDWLDELNGAIRTAAESSGDSRERFHEVFDAILCTGRSRSDSFAFFLFHQHALCGADHCCGSCVPTALVEFIKDAEGLSALKPELLGAWVWGLFTETIRAILTDQFEIGPGLLESLEEVCWGAITG